MEEVLVRNDNITPWHGTTGWRCLFRLYICDRNRQLETRSNVSKIFGGMIEKGKSTWSTSHIDLDNIYYNLLLVP